MLNKERYLLRFLSKRSNRKNIEIVKSINLSNGYWEQTENVQNFLNKLKNKYSLHSPTDWNSLTRKKIQEFQGGKSLIKKYSIYELKCFGCPEGKILYDKPPGFWKKKENILEFLLELKRKYNFQTKEDWNSLTSKQIQSNGGSILFQTYSLFELKCLGFPEGKNYFDNGKKPIGYWEKEENIIQFLNEIKVKYNFKTFDDWNLLSSKIIHENGGGSLLIKYSMYDLKCLGFPEGKSKFNSKNKPIGYWEKEENTIQFLNEIKEKYNLKTPEAWNLITHDIIKSNGGSSLLHKYTLFDLKCLGFPEGKSQFNSKNKPIGYWEKEENIIQFLNEIKEKYNLKTPEDWNLINKKHFKLNGGISLLNKYSLFDLKCLACPDGKSQFNPANKSNKYWENEENVLQFLLKLKEKHNLNSFEDWNLITKTQIKLNGGNGLLKHYSLYQLKCLACPNDKLKFESEYKIPSRYWNDKNNILKFLLKIKEKYNFKSPEDWNLLSKKHIQTNGGNSLFCKYSLYDLKCLACPEGKFQFSFKPNICKPIGYWEDENNIHNFINYMKENLNLQTPKDWSRLSKEQIISLGGDGLMRKLSLKQIIQYQNPGENMDDFINNSAGSKRSSQRWLFLQLQKLFPGEEIIEDYFHSELSRNSGFSVQFDIFLSHRNIAFEYHGIQHYEDLPVAFSPVEMYQNRDQEKIKLCKQFGIHLIIIPYWWDNNLESLRDTINSTNILH